MVETQFNTRSINKHDTATNWTNKAENNIAANATKDIAITTAEITSICV